ncbi:CU044_5270 family protein [Streptomyces sp. NPDC127068]|uniref:CU044_5270 family protein n=1 Tax=Streptomyces sp. NPDC127068 TaxID=3347127 RepID=UPI00364D8224
MNREQQGRVEQAERDEIRSAADVLPAAPCPELDPERMRERRHHLLNALDAPGDRRSSRGAPWAVRRKALALAAFTAAGVTATVLVFGPGGADPRPDARQPVRPASAAAVRMLEKAALAEDAKPVPLYAEGSYFYSRTVGHSTALSENEDGGMDRSRTDEDMEQWASVDGSEPTLQRADGKETLIPEASRKGSLNAPTYAFLVALPPDPAALIDQIYEDAVANHGPGSDSTTGPDQQAFVTIGDLLRAAAAPPRLTAALYRAAARIPGVVTVPHAVDAAGRSGVAVARVHDGERTEWIFDKRTMRLLGERTVLLEDNSWGEAGDAVTSVAVVEGGVVRRAGLVCEECVPGA